MPVFNVIMFICLFALVLNFIFTVKQHSFSKWSLVILINSTLFIAICNLVLWLNGYIVDSLNLRGKPILFSVNLVNVMLYIIVLVMQMKKYDRQKNLIKGWFILKARIILVCALLVMLCSCSNSVNSLRLSDNVTSSIAVKKIPEINSKYLAWQIYKESNRNDWEYTIQIPKLTIEKEVAQKINSEIDKLFTNYAKRYLEEQSFEMLYTLTEYYIDTNIISLKITDILYPTYGTDGDIYTVNYSIKEDKILPFEYALKQLNTTQEVLTAGIYKKYDNGNMKSIEANQFFINEEGKIIIVVIAVEQPPEVEAWKHIYYYDYTSKN